jgi:hypothetical protein
MEPYVKRVNSLILLFMGAFAVAVMAYWVNS